MDRIFDKMGKNAHSLRSFGLRPVDEARAAERRAAIAQRARGVRTLTRPFHPQTTSR